MTQDATSAQSRTEPPCNQGSNPMTMKKAANTNPKVRSLDPWTVGAGLRLGVCTGIVACQIAC